MKYWWKRLWCRHQWRHNVYERATGMPCGLWVRRCCKCGQWQSRDFTTGTYEWRNGCRP